MFSRHPTPLTSSPHARRTALPIVLVITALLAATLTPTPASGQYDAFSDSTDAGVHRPAVNELARLGIFEGTECDANRFCPRDPLKRWAMAVWLVRVLGERPTAGEGTTFADVDDELWWSDYVEQLAERGVTSGCRIDPPRYCPDRNVTRGQMATFLVSAFGLASAPPAGFTDTEDSVHADNIDALAAAGITAGCQKEPLRYCPQQPVTRGQMATLLQRAIEGSDRAVLVAFYNATGGDRWVDHENWLTDSPTDTWYGVTTDQTGRVTHLDLAANGLSGTLPSILARLAKLKTLDLADNRLSGSIPTELGSLRSLRQLDLESNALDGSIPSNLGKLEELTNLNLANNALTGSIPARLGNLVRLEHLYLHDNALTGSIPRQLGQLTNLITLMLRRNSLTGPIPPELSRMTSLEFLLLDNNRLTGAIPEQLGDMRNLVTMFLNQNRLSGPIPPELGELSRLRTLALESNDLTGRIPSELGYLQRLWSLNLANNMLEGRIPASIGKMSMLDNVKLSGNSLTGCIPPGLRDLHNDFHRMRLPYCGGG